MKKHRIFIAINLPDDVKTRLAAFQQKWLNLPVRWTKKENLHITLVFIGYVEEEQLTTIRRVVRDVAVRHPSFEIKLKRLCLGPPHRPARIIWVEGEKNQAIADLRESLEKTLFHSVNSAYHRLEKRPFQPHITLARINQNDWRYLTDKPTIDQLIDLTFRVYSIEIMESHLSRGGSNYNVLESIDLKE